MNKKKNIIIICISLILLVLIIWGLLLYNKNVGLEKINYEKVNELIEQEETFVLCISRTTCSHCDDFKPKLKEVANDYNIKVYYIDIDKETDENKDNFKDIISFNGETPTTVFIKNGAETTTANRINGNVSKKNIIKKFKTNGFID